MTIRSSKVEEYHEETETSSSCSDSQSLKSGPLARILSSASERAPIPIMSYRLRLIKIVKVGLHPIHKGLKDRHHKWSTIPIGRWPTNFIYNQGLRTLKLLRNSQSNLVTSEGKNDSEEPECRSYHEETDNPSPSSDSQSLRSVPVSRGYASLQLIRSLDLYGAIVRE